MLDEPTNHLDADTVEWLEDELDTLPGALLLVTHDRYFLDGLVDRIVEIEPGGALVSYPGNYEAYLEQKLVAQENASVAAAQARAVDCPGSGVAAQGPRGAAHQEQGAHRAGAQADGGAGLPAAEGGGAAGAPAPRLGAHRHRGGGRAQVLRRAQGARGREPAAPARRARGHGRAQRRGEDDLPARAARASCRRTRGKVVIGQEHARSRTTTRRAPRWTPSRRSTRRRRAGDDWVELGDERVALRDYLDDLLFPVPMQRMQVKALSGGERNRLLLARLFLRGRQRPGAGRAHERPGHRHAEHARAAAAAASPAACCW